MSPHSAPGHRGHLGKGDPGCAYAASPQVLGAPLTPQYKKDIKLLDCPNEGREDGERSKGAIHRVVEIICFVQPSKEQLLGWWHHCSSFPDQSSHRCFLPFEADNAVPPQT